VAQAAKKNKNKNFNPLTQFEVQKIKISPMNAQSTVEEKTYEQTFVRQCQCAVKKMRQMRVCCYFIKKGWLGTDKGLKNILMFFKLQLVTKCDDKIHLECDLYFRNE
jgi:hypothetical protein